MTYHEYIVVGAGPGGVQMGYFLEQAGRDYLMLEGGHAAAMFFSHKPRHRRLNSFNKRFNWFPEPEFNLRFDWNSMLTHDYSFPFREYSADLYPLADVMVQYLNDFVAKYEINVQFNTRVNHVSRDPETKLFILSGSDGEEYRCKVLLLATGPVKPNVPLDIEGIEHVEGYEDHDTDPKRFENKRVVILGKGNAAFETANHLANHAAQISILLNNKFLKHAWQTHYVGDVRAAGNAILDMSQLKLLHGVVGITPNRIEKQEDGTLRMYYTEEFPHWTNPGIANGYITVDHIIRCTGWKYLDPDLFDQDMIPAPADSIGKYPLLTSMWESTVPDLFYVGATMEGRNRRSPAGFIHGYRYTVRTLFRHLEERYQGVPVPGASFELKNEEDLKKLGDFLVTRISVSSGLYECYGILCDALVIDPKNGTAQIHYELPVDYVVEHEYFSDKKVVLFTLEYGFNNFGSSDTNTFVRRNDPDRPGCVAYLHPVFRYYENGQFVEGRNIRSSAVVRYDKGATDFDGDFSNEKPRNILLNFVNHIANVTSEKYPEEHFANTEEQGGFRAWPENMPMDDKKFLPQCVLSVGEPQVTDFEHFSRIPGGRGKVVPPWVHTL